MIGWTKNDMTQITAGDSHYEIHSVDLWYPNLTNSLRFYALIPVKS